MAPCAGADHDRPLRPTGGRIRAPLGASPGADRTAPARPRRRLAAARRRRRDDPRRRQAAGSRHRPPRFVTAAADAIPLPEASVDVAVSSFVLQLVPDRLAALREIRRVLRPGGRLAYATWLADDRP